MNRILRFFFLIAVSDVPALGTSDRAGETLHPPGEPAFVPKQTTAIVLGRCLV